MLNFNDKAILITGGSRGIGAAAAKMFSDCGGNVAIVYKSNDLAADKIKAYVQNNDRKFVKIKDFLFLTIFIFQLCYQLQIW